MTTKFSKHEIVRRATAVFATVLAVTSLAYIARADNPQGEIFQSGGLSPAEEVTKLTAVLKSNAPLYDKTLACKRLGIVGNENAVPTLAELLTNAELSHFARYALETIPSPAVDEALRKALTQVEGRQLIGVINSIGVRRDEAAIAKLTELLQNTDNDIAAAAAVSLGKIGSAASADVLLKALPNAAPPRQAALQDGCLRCAERLAAQNDAARARKLYEALAAKQSPRSIRLAAELGIVNITPDAGLAKLLSEYLKSGDDVQFEAAVFGSHNRKGAEVTKVLALALNGASEKQQVCLIDALQGRGDAAVADQVAGVVKKGSPALKIAALSCLGRVGDQSIVPLLVASAIDSDAKIAETAVTSLEGLRGSEVDDAVLKQLSTSNDAQRRVVIGVLGRRGVKAAAPELFKLLDSGDETTRLAALQALGQTVDEQGFAKLVERIPVSKGDSERQAAIASVNAACRRMPNADVTVAVVRDRLKSWPAEQQPLLLEILGAAGGEKALNIVAASADNGPPEMADAATRALGEWMTPDAAPVLYRIASGDGKYKIRALRGYIRIARQLNLPDEKRLEMCKQALIVAKRPEEKKLVLEVLNRCPSAASIEVASLLIDDAEQRPQATETVIAIAEKIKDKDPAAASAASQKVLAANPPDAIAQRARALVKPN